jgi:hypothetical protein
MSGFFIGTTGGWVTNRDVRCDYPDRGSRGVFAGRIGA